jgi:hypothetical protein
LKEDARFDRIVQLFYPDVNVANAEEDRDDAEVVRRCSMKDIEHLPPLPGRITPRRDTRLNSKRKASLLSR